MAVRIRLQRIGKKNRPTYRVAAVDRRFKRDGRFLEIVGNYSPLAPDPAKQLTLHRDRIAHWVSKGALMSDRVRQMVERSKPSDVPSPSQAAAPAAAAPTPKKNPAARPEK